jgi:quercetin dioxygenase-like cupin family protein
VEHWDVGSLTIEPHKPQVLRSDSESRVIALQLPAGEQLQEHQVHERAYVIVTDGQIEVEAGNGTISGGPGLLCHFDPRERHAVTAVRDARLLLLLSPWPGEGHPSLRA